MRQLEGPTKAQDGLSIGLVVSGKVGQSEGGLAAQALPPVGVHGFQEAHQPHQRLPGHFSHLVLAVPGASCMRQSVTPIHFSSHLGLDQMFDTDQQSQHPVIAMTITGNVLRHLAPCEETLALCSA